MSSSITADGPGDRQQQNQAALAHVLFDPATSSTERWGWFHMERPDPRTAVSEELEPQWQEPNRAEIDHLSAREARITLGTTAAGATAFTVGVGGAFVHLAALGIAVVGIPLAVGIHRLAAWQLERAFRVRDEAYRDYQTHHQAWKARRSAFSQEQQRVLDSMKEWFPFTASRSQRVDVFGGTPEGWSSLLATLGTSLLAQGQALTVLDFTETHIALPLARFTRTVGLPVHAIGLPRTLADSGLLQGLQGAEIATLVAEALSVLNPTPLSHTEITTYSDLLIAVTESLERGYTFRRLAAGLQVLSSIARPADEDFPLSREETRAILSRLGTVGASPAANDALRHLRRLIADLAVHETPPPDNDATAAREPLRLCPAQGLVVTYTTGGDSTSKAFLDALVLRRLQHHLSSQQRTPGQDVVFLAGADRFSAPVLDSLTRAARRAEVRLILLFEQLHEQHQHLLGNRDSATVLMRLGNAKEATMAADNIGREHRFTLTQVSTSTGTTYTHGTSINHGAQKSTSTTDSTGDSSNRQAWRWTDDSHSRNSSQTEGASESTSWGSSVSESTAEAETTGTTETRTYEHTVEPSTLQNLPPTAFIVIAPGPGGRLVQAGDCDPGIALRPTTHIARPAVRRGEHGPA